jgi:hypothetical protein
VLGCRSFVADPGVRCGSLAFRRWLLVCDVGLWLAAARCSNTLEGSERRREDIPRGVKSDAGVGGVKTSQVSFLGEDHRGSDEPIRSLAPLT